MEAQTWALIRTPSPEDGGRSSLMNFANSSLPFPLIVRAPIVYSWVPGSWEREAFQGTSTR